MTTTPRESDAPKGADSGASAVMATAVRRGSQFWGRVQRTRPWRTFSHFVDTGGNVLASGMSYQALFAVFAALWVGFGVFGIALRDRPELLEELVTQINASVPGLLGSGDEAAVNMQVLLRGRALDWTSVIAGLALLWVALNWFTGTRRSIRIIFGLEVKQYRNVVLLKLRDLMLALCFGLAILISAALTVLSSNLAGTVAEWAGMDPDSWFLGGLGTFARYGAMYVFDVLVLMAMHRVLAEVRVPKLRLVAGCALGGVALLVLKILGAQLLGGATSNPLLATFAVLVGLLLWFSFVCRALLLTASWIATGIDRSLGLPHEGSSAAAALFGG